MANDIQAAPHNPAEDIDALRDLTDNAQSAEDIATLKAWHEEARTAHASVQETQNIGHNALAGANAEDVQQAMAVHSGYENDRRAYVSC